MKTIKSIVNGDLASALIDLEQLNTDMKPVVSQKGIRRVCDSVANFTEYEEFADYLISLVVRIKVYHVEFLTYKYDYKYVPLALEAIRIWEEK